MSIVCHGLLVHERRVLLYATVCWCTRGVSIVYHGVLVRVAGKDAGAAEEVSRSSSGSGSGSGPRWSGLALPHTVVLDFGGRLSSLRAGAALYMDLSPRCEIVIDM